MLVNNSGSKNPGQDNGKENTQGSEYYRFGANTGLTQQMATSFDEMLKEAKAPLKVVVFDKTNYPQHAYDHIMVTHTAGDTVYGYIMMITATGAGPVNMADMISSSAKNIPVFLPARTMESHLIGVMKNAIGTNKLILAGQLNVGIDKFDLNINKTILELAVNGVLEKAGVIKPNVLNQNLDYSLNMRPQNDSNENIFGMVKATSWSCTIAANSTSNVNHPNKASTGGVLINTSGVVDVVTTRREEQTPTGPVQVAVSTPIVQVNCATSDGSQKQGVTQALLALFAADVVSSRSNWVLPLLASPYNIGALEKHYSNKVIKLNDQSLPIDKKRLELSKLITQQAMTCLSVDDMSIEGGPMTAFVGVGLGDGHDGKDIVTATHALTRGIFPVDYNVGEIVTAVVTLPSGTYIDNNTGKTRDLGELTQAFFLNADSKKGLEYAFRYCQIIAGETPNSFSAMVTLLDEAIGGGNIMLNGSRALVYLNSKFLDTMITSMSTAGLTPRFDDMLEDLGNVSLAVGNGIAGAARNHMGISPSSRDRGIDFGPSGQFAGGNRTYRY